MEKRGRIPIATFRSNELKPRSRSRVRDTINNSSDSETDMFTLLEENLSLKEENKALKEQLLENVSNIKNLKENNMQLQLRIKENNGKLNKAQLTGSVHEVSTNFLKKCNCKSESLAILRRKNLNEKFAKFSFDENEFSNILDYSEDQLKLMPFEHVQNLFAKFSQLKANYNNAELQLYEANEKISELLEKQIILEAENNKLKMKGVRSTNL